MHLRFLHLDLLGMALLIVQFSLQTVDILSELWSFLSTTSFFFPPNIISLLTK